MTFKELVEAAEEIRADGDSLCIGVELWVDDSGRRDLKWKVWSHDSKNAFEGDSAKIALRRFEGAMRINVSEVDPVLDPRQPELIDATQEVPY